MAVPLLGLSLLLIALAGAGTWVLAGHRLPALTDVFDAPVARDATPILFRVPAGATAGVVGDELERAGLIRSALRFRQLALFSGLDGRLEAGSYELRRDMSVAEILETLASGKERRANLVTIPEGWRAEEVATYLQTKGLVDAEAFLGLVAHGSADLSLPAGAESFEGYLFPDSYEFPPGASPTEVLRTFAENFDGRISDPMKKQAEAQGLSLTQAIILASIVEREAADPSERGRIAEVFHNRLRQGRALEADPTVQYSLVPLGSTVIAGGFWKRYLDESDLRVESLYNTYQHPGLPPGPICSPGLASIQAVLAPEPGPWLYFVARGDGTHLFASTLDEHLNNLAQARREG